MDKLTLLSLSNDLKRITTSIQRGSYENSQRFCKEAKVWLGKAEDIEDDYLKKLAAKISKTLARKDDLSKAEDCLMFSVLLQNQALIREG